MVNKRLDDERERIVRYITYAYIYREKKMKKENIEKNYTDHKTKGERIKGEWEINLYIEEKDR